MSESQNGYGALFAGGLAVILVSACCFGPLALTALGFSGAWIGNLIVLEPYRPIFIGVVLVALFLARRRVYHPTQACRPNEACVIPQVWAAYEPIFWVVAVLALVAPGFPYVMPFFYRSEFTIKKLLASLALAAVVAPVWAVTRPVTSSVLGVMCSACSATVKEAISKVGGVSKVAVTFETCEAVVIFDDTKTSVQKLAKTAGDAGYPSSVRQ